ncbi:hypothetical protein SAMN05892883_2599 [Jatrophihabitans sp. GAS493]|uniref:hypothetical protein n=1 Tax=Jatrophihabitans sp. GAS493 TaxID=1907575 RepID=UPI000BB82EF9|nr:hypothetical protein [Jatrophihabitans sp. GAS493]SOD73307.1 hypothetical protein SAMN05892883_2599 [Jatrophihabitans sp. GAS493]
MTVQTSQQLTHDRGIPAIAWIFVAIVGAAAFGGSGGLGGSISFLAGLAIAGLWLKVSTIAVRRAGKYSPTTSLLAALMSYSGLIVLFAILLGSSESSGIHSGAFAAGLVSAVIISCVDQLRRGWIWSERR